VLLVFINTLIINIDYIECVDKIKSAILMKHFNAFFFTRQICHFSIGTNCNELIKH